MQLAIPCVNGGKDVNFYTRDADHCPSRMPPLGDYIINITIATGCPLGQQEIRARYDKQWGEGVKVK